MRVLQEFLNYIAALFHPKRKNSDDSLYADKYQLYLQSKTDGSRIITIPIEISIRETANFAYRTKLYIPSTLNIDLIMWHTQLIVYAEKC